MILVVERAEFLCKRLCSFRVDHKLKLPGNQRRERIRMEHNHSVLMKCFHEIKNRTSRNLNNTKHGHSQLLLKHSQKRKNRTSTIRNLCNFSVLNETRPLCFTTFKPRITIMSHFIIGSCYFFTTRFWLLSSHVPLTISYSSTILIPDQRDNHLLQQTRILFPVYVDSAK